MYCVLRLLVGDWESIWPVKTCYSDFQRFFCVGDAAGPGVTLGWSDKTEGSTATSASNLFH